MASVYRKTAKGQTEIETRVNRLTPRLRTSLILVDGKRSDDDLRVLIATGADEVLATLTEQGYIEVVAAAPSRSAAPPGASPAPAAASAQAATPRKVDDVRRAAVRFLNDQMGPSAESLALKIEKSHDWAELQPHLEMAEHFLRAARGAATAREFAAKFLEGNAAPPG
jgi:hypothetical protein